MPKIVRFHQLGEPDVLTVEEIAEPRPAAGEVRIGVDAFALNRADVLWCRPDQSSVMAQPVLPSG